MFNRLIEIPHIKSGSQLKGLDDGLPSASLGRVMFLYRIHGYRYTITFKPIKINLQNTDGFIISL